MWKLAGATATDDDDIDRMPTYSTSSFVAGACSAKYIMCVHSAISNRLSRIDAGQSRAHRRTRIVDSSSSLDSDAHVTTGIVLFTLTQSILGTLKVVAQSRHDQAQDLCHKLPTVVAGSPGAKAHSPGPASDSALQLQPPAPPRRPLRPPCATNKKALKASAGRITELSVTIGSTLAKVLE